MKIVIDTAAGTLTQVADGAESSVGLFTRTAFEALSEQWVRIGWSLKYYHNFSWMGLPILQLPEDLLRLQEVIYQIRPSVIVETGVFRGGSLLFHATICQALGQGRVIGIDREIAASDRDAISRHLLGPRITLLEGSSADSGILASVQRLIQPADSVLVILDSCHTREHVARELACYAPLVTKGSYIIATDGIMRDLADVPGGTPSWKSDNPFAAATEFASLHPEFHQEQPPWMFHDGALTENVTYWPGAWLKRIG